MKLHISNESEFFSKYFIRIGTKFAICRKFFTICTKFQISLEFSSWMRGHERIKFTNLHLLLVYWIFSIYYIPELLLTILVDVRIPFLRESCFLWPHSSNTVSPCQTPQLATKKNFTADHDSVVIFHLGLHTWMSHL